MVQSLRREGIRLTVGRATVWFPKEGFTPERMREIASHYDRTITAIRELVNAPRSWQRFPDSHVTYFLGPGRFISHANGARVFMPAMLVRTDRAPAIHETAHAVLTPRRFWAEGASPTARERMRRDAPVWLEEGLASYISDRLAQMSPIPEVAAFDRGGPVGVHRRCTERTSDEVGRMVMTYVGTRGRPPGFDTERALVARPFYTCSASYVTFLVERYGIEAVAALRDHRDTAVALAKLAGKPADEVRAEWMSTLPVLPPSHLLRTAPATPDSPARN